MNRNNTSADALIFFCHGSRDPLWREPFDQILIQYRSQHPQSRVELAFLELMEPDLGSIIDSIATDGIEHIRIVPLFLAAGRHTRRDLPAILDLARQRWPSARFSVSPTLTEATELRAAIVDWAATAGD